MSNWIDNGHGDGTSLAPVRATAPGDSAGSAQARRGTWRSRFGSPIVVAMVVAAVLVGSAGTAYAIRETIFPRIGASTSRSVWQNPAPAGEPTAVAATTAPNDAAADSTVPATTVPASSVPDTAASVTTVPVTAPTGPVSTGPVPSVSAGSVVPTVTFEDNSGHGGDDDGGGDDDSDHSGSGRSGSDDNSGSGSGSGSDDDSGSDD